VKRIVVPETATFHNRPEHLGYRVREFFDYLDNNNKGTLLDYGKRCRAGKPISTAMVGSAVNQVVNARMCKRQQMRCAAILPAPPLVTTANGEHDSGSSHGSPDRVEPTLPCTPRRRCRSSFVLRQSTSRPPRQGPSPHNQGVDARALREPAAKTGSREWGTLEVVASGNGLRFGLETVLVNKASIEFRVGR